MFNKNIKPFKKFILESLFINNWRNYKDDTDLGSDKTSKESNDISQIILKSFESSNPSDLIFTSNDIAFGEDYLFFMDIVRSLSPVNVRTLNMPGYVVYVSIFQYNEKNIATVDIISNDSSTYSHIFINKNDFDYFDPEKRDEVENQEDQMEDESEEDNAISDQSEPITDEEDENSAI
jgi:hypothetical protein